MRISQFFFFLGTLAFLTGCGPQGPQAKNTTAVELKSSTPAGEMVTDTYLEGFASHTDQGSTASSDAPLDLAAGEALVLVDRVNLATAPGGSDGPVVRLSTKVKVMETGAAGWKVQLSDGSAGWLPVSAVAQEVRRAVLKTDGPEGWSKFTFIGYKPLADNPGQVEAWAAPASGTGEQRKAILPRSVLTLNTNDINLVVLWRLAALEADPAGKTALWNEALSKYSASSFTPMVQEALDTSSGKTVVATTEVTLIVSAAADGIKVWAEPAEKGTPVATLAANQQVQVVEQSNEPQTIGGTSARWYKIADPVGWVFGADVKQ